jgi:L-rhamnose mutarotase
MQHAAFTLRVKQGEQNAYLEAHRTGIIWPSIVEACRLAGMVNYSGWIGGDEDRQIFAYFESEDVRASLELLSANQANSEWQGHMAHLMDTRNEVGVDRELALLRPAFFLP